MEGGGIELSSGVSLQVTGKFNKGKSAFTVMNRGSGTSTTQWERGTLFIVSGKGIIYGDREMTPDEFMEDKKDAIKLKYNAIDEYTKNPDNVIAVDLPYKPEVTEKDRATRVSMTVAKDIIETQKLGGLRKGLEKARVPLNS